METIERKIDVLEKKIAHIDELIVKYESLGISEKKIEKLTLRKAMLQTNLNSLI